MPSSKRPHSLEALNNVVGPAASDKVIPFRPRGAEATVSANGIPAPYTGQPGGAVPQAGQPVGQMPAQGFGGVPGAPDMRAPLSREAARRRRRNVVIGLFALSVTTLVLAIAYGRVFTLLFLIADAALLGFVMLVVQHERSSTERFDKVQPIRPPAQNQGYVQAAPEYLVRESAN